MMYSVGGTPEQELYLPGRARGSASRLNRAHQIPSFVAFAAGGLDLSNLCMDLSIRWTDSAAYQRSSVLLVNFKSLSRTQKHNSEPDCSGWNPSLITYQPCKFAMQISYLSMLTVRSTYKDTKQFFSGSYSLYAYLLSLLYPDYNINNTRKYLQSFYPL